jgi:carboxymethylenebutenolidase
MSAHSRIPVALTLTLCAACAGTRERTPADDPGWTGALTEEEFKALHEHADRPAPPSKGETIALGDSRAYLSLPEDPQGPLPGVILIHEWWGLNENIEHWADRLAADGYAALAVDLYGGKTATDPDEAMALVRAVDEVAALGTLRAAHRFLVQDPRIAARRTGSIGWCFGGAWSLRLALAEPELDACVIYYGRLVNDPERLAQMNAELLGIFGSRDTSIPPDAVADFGEALTQAGRSHTIRVYDADHAFANPSSARYDEDAASAAWEEARAFLARTLKGAP